MKKIPLFTQVWEFITKYKMFNKEAHVLIALSGGADSITLTMLLKEIQANICPELRLHLAHLNHKLRGKESEQDELFVRNFATRFNLELTVNQIDVGELAKGANLEATARKIRYNFLQEIAKKIDATSIVTAHNMNDQAETFLMRLIRGSGVTGLSAIKPILKMNHILETSTENYSINNHSKNPTKNYSIPIVRPLLNTKRSEIENYLKEKNITACIDSSNFSTKLTRNKIRLEVLPRMLEINPKAIEAIVRSVDMLKDWQEIVIDTSENQVINNEIRFSLDSLKALPSVMRHQKLRDSIELINGKVSGLTAKHIFSIDSLLITGKSGKKIVLPNNLEVAREFDHIIIRPATNTLNSTNNNQTEVFDLLLNGYWKGKLFTLSYQRVSKIEASSYPKGMFSFLDLDKTGESLKVRFRLPGDKYQPIGHQKDEKLKRLMLEARIALSARNFWPIVTTVNNEIVWSPCLPVAAEFAANSKSSHFAIINAK